MDADFSGTEPAPHRDGRARARTRPILAALRPAGLLAAAFVVYTWAVVQWPPMTWFDTTLDARRNLGVLVPVLHVLDRVGQRAVCVPVLAIIVLIMCWRHRAIRPLFLGVVALIGLNLLVLILKVWLARGEPLARMPSFFAGGQEYPSGHTANVIVMYGLCVYLLRQYGGVSRRVRNTLIGVVAVLSGLMFATSLLLRWHWFSDLVGGYLIGGAVLALLVGIDLAIPFRSRRLVVAPPPAESGAALAAAASPAETAPAAASGTTELEGRRASHAPKVDELRAPAGRRSTGAG